MYWSDRLRRLSPYVPGEQPRDRQFIKLNTNENPYPPSPLVLEAIQRAVGESLRLYPDPSCTALREAIAARYGVKPEQVFPGNGSDEVLAFAFAAFFPASAAETGGSGNAALIPADAANNTNTDDTANTAGSMNTVDTANNTNTADNADAANNTNTDDTVNTAGSMNTVDTANNADNTAVLFPDITYSFYSVYADLWGVPVRTIPLDDELAIRPEDYRIPNGGIIFPNPNAPTGRILNTAALLSLAEWQERQGRLLIVDEAYIAFGGETLIPYLSSHPNLVLIHTLSKYASLAGLRVGFAIAREELIEGLCRLRDSFNSYTLDRLAQAAAAAAISDAPYYDELSRRITATRRRVASALERRGFTVIPSSANFLFVRFPGMPGAEAFARLREKGILVRRFDRDRIADFLRVSMGTDAEMDCFLAACGEIGGNI
ncbi:MAG: aminotransferase class I/II-fold pyridoxal phosphate-dependent enzyme [Treponema sp.]|nr:aminotransferase class I/II-fold pyridoxal phosphate-dependent enzyme [Treponema sp.]